MKHLTTLTTLIGKRAAEKLYNQAGENFILLAEEDLAYIVGKKAAGIVKAAISISEKQYTKPKQVISSRSIYEMNLDMRNLQYEEFRVIYLRSKLTVIKTSIEATGGLAAVLVDGRKIWANALLCKATQIALVHNHPSGPPDPSHSDLSLTSLIIQQSKIMGINVVDHVIVGSTFCDVNNEYYSFADNGTLE